jgi:hypothetical protein
VAVVTGEADPNDHEALGELRSTAPQKFDVEEMTAEIDQVASAIALGLGTTANAELKKRLAQKLLPNVDSDARDAIESEIDDDAKAEADMRDAGRQAQKAALEAGPQDPNAPPEDDAEAEPKTPVA